jgi:hypothetical protein
VVSRVRISLPLLTETPERLMIQVSQGFCF